MANGELLFDEPWQGRIVGMAESLAAGGAFAWSDFQRALIRAIEVWEAAPENADAPYRYYDHFLTALEHVLVTHDCIQPDALQDRVAHLSPRPHGHDH